MSRILHHVGQKEFKKIHQRKLDEQNLLWQEEQKKYSNIQEIKRISERFKSDWRTELAEAMSSKDFPYIYGGVVAVDILSLTNLPGSQFAQNSIQSGAKQTDYSFGSEFPGSYVNSIGDFSPQSYSKADINMMAVPTPSGDAVAWNPFDSTLPTNFQLAWSTPSRTNADITTERMVSRGETTDTHTDIYFSPQISQTGDTITITRQVRTNDYVDYTALDSADLMVLTGLWSINNATKPMGKFDTNTTDLKPMPFGYDMAPVDAGGESNDDFGEPIDLMPMLRTYKNKSAGDVISFDWEFDAGTGRLSNPNNSIVDGSADYDDSAWVYINGSNTWYRLANIIDFDNHRIGDDSYYEDWYDTDEEEPDGSPDWYIGDRRQEDNAGRKPIRPEFRTGGSGKLTGSFSYTVKSDDIDSNGNFKIWIVNNQMTLFNRANVLKISNMTGTNTAKISAGKLGNTTDAYDLGYRVENPKDLFKLLKGEQLGRFRVKKTTAQNLKDKHGYESKEYDGWMEDYLKGGKTQDPIGDLLIMGLSLIVAKTLVAAIGPAAAATITRGAKILDQFGKWWNKGKNVRIKNEDTADLGTLWADEMAQLTRSDAAFQAGKTGISGWNPFKAFTPKMIKTGPSPAVRQSLRLFKPATAGGSQTQKESYDLLSEQVTSDDKFIEKMKMVLNKIKTDDELQSLIKFLNKVSKAKEKFEQKTAGEGNSNALYSGQPSPNGFPDNPPAQLAPNGYHPEFGKRANRYRTLDPISAKTMARVMTGDPETDSQVAAAARQPKVAPQKSTTWRRAKKHLRRA